MLVGKGQVIRVRKTRLMLINIWLIMKNKISMTKMPISMTFNRISPDLQDFQAWNQQVKISKTFQIFKAPYKPCGP
jgi:hypothetical protein